MMDDLGQALADRLLGESDCDDLRRAKAELAHAERTLASWREFLSDLKAADDEFKNTIREIALTMHDSSKSPYDAGLDN